ncbi:MAG: twin-arginine translocase subunit TatC [Vicingaceae bacterium]
MSLDQSFDEEEGGMSFLDHLEILRWHLIRIVLALLICAVVAFVFKGFVFDTVVLAPSFNTFITYQLLCDLSEWLNLGENLCFKDLKFELINLTMAGQFSMHIIVSVVAGVIVAFPYILYELWRFIKPALKKSEKNYARGIVFWGSLLFMSGVAFGYYVITPMSVQFLGGYRVSDFVQNQISLKSYISTVSTITLATGIIFQLPIVVYFLSKVGLVTPHLMKTYRRHAIIAVLILSAIITPPDITSQVLVSIPLLILYEVSILISRAVVRKEQKEEQE